MSQPQWLAFDPAGNLYVGNYAGHNVTMYQPPFSTSSSTHQTFGSSATIDQPQAIAADNSGNVYVANTSSSTAVEFGSNGTLMRTLTNLGLSGTNLVAVDPMGNAYLPDENTESIGVYPPGTSTTASPVYSNGLDGPMDVVVWP